MTTRSKSDFSIAVAQSSSVKGDIDENIRRHARFVSIAVEHGANVVVFPELSLTGYEPIIAAETAIDSGDRRLNPLQDLSDRFDVTTIAGCPIRSDNAKPWIGAVIFRPDSPVDIYRKRFLHGDEVSHFSPCDDVVVCRSHGRDIGMAICADIQNPAHPADASREGANVYVASVAITPNGIVDAEASMSDHARKHQFLSAMSNYASETGGYSIAGRSSIWNESGEVIARAPEFGEYLIIATTTPNGWKGKQVAICNSRADVDAPLIPPQEKHA